MKSLLIVLSLLITLVLTGCKEGTIVYDVEFPRADSPDAQPKRIAPARVSLRADSSNLAENAGTVLINATLNKTAASTTTVLLSLSGSATLNTDYNIDNTTIEIPAGSLTASTTLRSLDDLIDDDAETIVVEISSVSGGDGATEDGDQQKMVTITDDEVAPAVTLAASASSFLENAANPAVTLTVSMTAAATSNTTILLGVSGTATAGGVDYSIGSTTLVIPAGSTSITTTLSSNDDPYYDDGETIIVEISSVSGSTAVESGSQRETITINDDEAQPTVSLTVGSNNLTEAAGATNNTSVTATLSYVNSTAVSINLSLIGTASDPADYGIGTTSLTIPAGSTTATTTVTTQNDLISEGTETVIIDIGSVSGGDSAVEASPAQQQTISITDDEANPSVTLSTSTNSLNETGAGDNATLTVTMNPVASSATTVTLALSGTATGGGSDYSIDNTVLTIAAGVATATATIRAQDDPYYDDGETIIVDINSVSGGNSATESGTQQEILTFNDNEIQPTVSLTVDSNSMGETGGSVTLTATLSYVNSASTSVTLGTSGTAVGGGTDFTLSSSTITIAAGNTTGTATLSSVGDSISDPTETVIVDITNVSGGDNATEATPAQRQTVTITDDEALPVISLSSSASTVSEANASVTLTVTATPASSSVITVNLAETGTASGGGVDYSLGAGVLNISAGSTTATTSITAVDDGIYDPAETVIIDISSVSGGGATESGSQQETVTITDDEGAPTVSLSVDSNTVSEGDGVGARTVTVTLSNTASDNVTVGLSTSGTTTGGGVDYTLNSNSLLIAAGSTTASTTLDISEDLLIEGTETIIVDISSVTNSIGITENGVQTETINLTDNEAGPTVSISSSSPIAENGGVSTVTATMSAAAAQSTTINLLFSGTADNGTDYLRSASSITIAAGNTSGSITVTGVNDSFNDEAETVIVDIDTVSGGNGASESGTQRETITITDDDPAPTVSLSISVASVTESAGANAVTLTATMSAVAESSTSVTLSLSGTATEGAGTDYTINSSTITIAAGNTTGTAQLSILEDSFSEVPNETIVVDIASVSGGDSAVEAAPAQQVAVTITDNEATPQITLAPTPTSPIAENGGTSTVTVSSTPASSSVITVNFSLSGSADNGSDYSIGTTSLTIPANTASTSTLVSSLNDGAFDPAETIVIDIASVSGGSAVEAGGNQQETITITDDESFPVVNLSANNSTISEGAGSGAIVVTVSLSNASPTSTTVGLTTTGSQTATGSGVDYTLNSNSLVISAGSTTATTTIDLVDDTLVEGAETIELEINTVSSASGVSENGTQQYTINLTDNEASPTVGLSASSPIAENGGVSTVTATLSVAAAQSTTVNLLFSGIADNGTDYSLSGTVITIAGGSTSGSITVTGLDDLLNDEAETVVVDIDTVSGGNGASESGTQQATIIITDDDNPPVVDLLVSASSVNESSGSAAAAITALLDHAATVDTLVTLSPSGTADNGSDYTLDNFTISVSAGATSGTTNLNLLQDSVSENPAETIVLDITSVSGGDSASENGTQSQTITLVDDDATPQITLAPTPTSPIAENGGTSTVTVTSSIISSSAITVTLAPGAGATATGGGTDYSLGSSSLVIAAGSSTQSTTITSVDDNITEGNEAVVLDITGVSGGGAAESGTPQQIAVTITDDDSAGFTLSKTTASVAETGTTDTFTVVLNSEPTANVTLTLSDNDSTEVLYPSSLVFSTGNWSTSQTVTLTGKDDDVDDGNRSTLLTLTPGSTDGNYNSPGLAARTVTVTTTDNDTAGFTLSKTTASVAETGTTDTFTVVLNSEPTANVTLTLSDNDSTEVLYPSSLVFSTGNWSTSQTVTLTGKDDDVDDGNRSTLLTLTPGSTDGNYNSPGLAARTVTVTTTDNDTAGFAISRTTANVSENGTSVTFTVVLNTEPTNTVEFDITSDDLSEARVSPGSLTFSTGNWTVSQTVTITGWDDSDDDDNVTSTTSVAIDQPNTLDSVYDGVGLKTINVLTIDDEEMPIVTLSAAANNVAESGTVQITATQNRIAGTDTTVNLSTTNVTTSAGDYNAPGAITITAGSTSGSVNFAPVNDSVDEDNESLMIQISSVSGGESAAAGTPQQISVVINDDDTAGFNLSTTSVSVNESGTTSQNVTVVLNTKPSGNVVLDLTHNDPSEASISPSSLTFTTGNWNTAQSLTVTALNELIDDGNVTSTVTVAVNTSDTADAKYDILGSQSVTVITVDDDTSTLTVPVLACAVEIGQVKLTWTDIYTIDGAGPVDSYILYWDISSGIDELDNSVTNISEKAMTDTPNAYFHGGLSDNYTYSYRVAVVNSGMVQTLSNEVSCQPLAPMCDITSGYIVDNDPDLVAYYPFEENTNDILSISKTGSPYHLSVQTGSVNYADSCVMGKSIYLNGNTYLENTDFNLNNITEIEDNFTASMWVIADKDNIRNASVLASGEKIGGDWDELSQVSYDTDGSLKWRVRKTSGSGSVDGPIMVLGEWYHLVMTHGKTDNHAEYFVDGVSQGTRPGAVHNWRKLRIGRNRAGAIQWKGYIDELKIYKRTMNSSEVENLYLKSLAPSTKNINLTSGGSGTLNLDWNDVKGHTGNYRVYRGTSSDFYVNISSDTPIYDGTTSGYSDTSLVSGQNYCYRVLSRSINGRGNMSDDFCRNAP